MTKGLSTAAQFPGKVLTAIFIPRPHVTHLTLSPISPSVIARVRVSTGIKTARVHGKKLFSQQSPSYSNISHQPPSLHHHLPPLIDDAAGQEAATATTLDARGTWGKLIVVTIVASIFAPSPQFILLSRSLKLLLGDHTCRY